MIHLVEIRDRPPEDAACVVCEVVYSGVVLFRGNWLAAAGFGKGLALGTGDTLHSSQVIDPERFNFQLTREELETR